MATRRSLHVVPAYEQGEWMVIESGALKAIESFGRKVDAVHYARLLGREAKTSLYIHLKDGSVQKRHSYGADLLLRQS